MTKSYAPFLLDAFSERLSKTKIEEILAWVGKNTARADLLMDMCLGEPELGMNGGWVLYHLGERTPELLTHRISDALPTLRTPYHPSIARGILKIIMHAKPFDEDLSGKVLDILFEKTMDPKQTIAIRALSIEGIVKHGRRYPELMEELKLILANMLQQEELSAGLRFKCKKFLKLR